jgi:hypothetical protein
MEPYQIRDLAEMVIISGTFLASLFMITRVFISRRARIGREDLKQLVESVNGLRESVDGMRLDVGDITERLDFTERVLARMADDKKLGRGQPPEVG